jgi:acetyltransferase
MRAFGPNTLGIVNTETGLTTSYFADKRMLQRGSIGFAAQSGIFVGALLRYLASFDGLHISKGIGLGNKVDVNESDALDFFADDAQTKTIGIYLEDVRDGSRFVESARRAAKRKPVLVLKGGRTYQGARATASHTASLAVDDAVFDGALRQAGALRMDGVADMLATLMGFEWMPLPRGNRIAVATFSGAQAIMSIDAAMGQGLGMAAFSPRTNERLSRVISFPSKMQNPIDLFPDMMAHGFEKTSCEILNALLDDDGVHGIVFIGFAMLGEEMFRPMAEVIRESQSKPVFVSLLGSRGDISIAEDFLRSQRIPVLPFPEAAIQVFARMWRYVQMNRLR